MINLDRLQTWLNQANLQQTNPPLYQFLQQLTLATRELQTETNAAIAEASGSITDVSDLDFLTHSDELVALPNSRQLIAGTNVSFDDTIVGERTINVTGGSGNDHVVMSDGNQPPTPLDDGNGNFIYVNYTP